jgi:hypothetical protein
MDNNEKLSRLENEIKDLQNEVRAVRLNLRGNHRPARTPAPVFSPRTMTAAEQPPETGPAVAREETARTKQPLPAIPPAGLPVTLGTAPGIDTVNVAGLAGWAEESTRQLGRERTGTLLDIAEKMGYLPPQIKRILFDVINAEEGGNSGNIVARDYLDAMVKIREKRREALVRLLSV